MLQQKYYQHFIYTRESPFGAKLGANVQKTKQDTGLLQEMNFKEINFKQDMTFLSFPV